MLNRNATMLVVIDIQGKLAHLMADHETLFANTAVLVQGAALLKLPILWTEQLPDKIGPTVPELAGLLDQYASPIAKYHFSCCGSDAFCTALTAANRSQVLIAGIETHVCVYQTVVDLVARGFEVQVVADAVSSRTVLNRTIGLNRIERAGAELTCTEMALFELLGAAEGAEFKTLIKLIK